MNKVLLISEIFPPTHGGSGRWFWDLYSRLDSDNYHIAAGKVEGCYQFDNHSEMSIHRLNLSSDQWGLKSFKGITFYIKSILKIRKLIKQNKITALHLGRCLPEGVIGLFFKVFYKIPYLCYIHGEDVETARSSREFILIINQVLKHAGLIICNSKNTQKILINKWDINQNKTKVLYPGIDANKFIPAQRSEEIRKKLGWEDKFVILTVGRLQKRKGHDMMIKAVDYLKKEKSLEILYVIIGDGAEKQHLDSLVEKYNLEDNVKFAGEINDQLMLESYQQSDIFILPNRQDGDDIEGFGIVLVEAQSCELPVIAGDSGGTYETMKVGETGFIVDCRTAENIANKLYELYEDSTLRRNMGKSGRAHIMKNLDWSQILEVAKNSFNKLN